MWLASASAPDSAPASALGNTKAQTYCVDEAAVVAKAAVGTAEAAEAGRIIWQSLTGEEGIVVVAWVVLDGWLAALFINLDWSVQLTVKF